MLSERMSELQSLFLLLVLVLFLFLFAFVVDENTSAASLSHNNISCPNTHFLLIAQPMADPGRGA